MFFGQPSDIMDTFIGSPSTGGGVSGAGAGGALAGAAGALPKPFASGGEGPRRLAGEGPRRCVGAVPRARAGTADRPLPQAVAEDAARRVGMV